MSDEPDFSTRVRCLVELYHAEENVQKDLDDTLALKRELVKFLSTRESLRALCEPHMNRLNSRISLLLASLQYLNLMRQRCPCF